MNKYLILIISIVGFLKPSAGAYGQANYLQYHKEIIKCEELIAEGKFKDAINSFDSIFDHFDFAFLRDYKLATELSAFEQDSKSSFRFMRLAILHGWTLKSIQKNRSLSYLHRDPQWINVESEYDSLHNIYWSQLDIPLRNQVHEMYKKDQKKALGALFKIGEKNQTKYAEKKFAPHSEKQLAELNKILTEQGYPGEKLVGNKWWVSVILSHHNSISKEYALKDTIFLKLRPMLIRAIEHGELHPYEFAIIEDWRTAALHQHQSTSYGFLGVIPDKPALEKVNLNRNTIGLRSIELRNKLIDIEKESGLNLYLTKGWQKSKITVANK